MNNPQINPINPDDPKWTAYVLGELDEVERAEIERLLETSDEARALVDELSLAAMALKEELAPLSALAMTPEQKAAIRAAAEPAPSRFALFPMKWGWTFAGAAAAVVLAVVPVLLVKDASQGSGSAEVKIAQYNPETEKLQDAQQQQSGNEANESRQQAEASAEKTELKRQDQFREAESQLRARDESDDRKDVNAVEDNLKQTERAATPSPAPPVPVSPPPALQKTVVSGVLGGQVDNPALVGAATGAVRAKEEPAAAPTAPIVVAPQPTPSAFLQRQQVQQQGQGQRGAGAGGGGGRGGGGARGAAAAGRGGAVNAESSLTTDTTTGDALLNLPDNEADLLRYLQELAAKRGIVDGELDIRVDGFQQGQNGQLPNRAATPPPPPPAAPVNRINAPGPNTEAYDRIVDNPFIRTTQQNLATFSIDVDTASYANMRRFLTQNQMPPRDSVRIEELINYFNYDYAQPRDNHPIAPNMEVAATPWNPQSRLVRIGIKAREVNTNRRPPSNLVFLIDVSGSMNTPVKLPLVKAGLKMMVDRLGENDTVSIVVYAGASGLVLPPTSAVRKERIQQAIDGLQPGGSTNGASGIQLAYNQAVVNFIKGGTNRVILMTDGDFNVGVTNQGDLTRLIEQRAKSGVFLSVLGFGMGNIKDSTLEKLADQGNGHYAYIDNINEARKVLVEEMGSTLVTVAKDVKIQVDFNPARVEAYRLIGYENRVLRTEDFNNDLKDAGDMGAGHTVTALFEVVPKGGVVPGPSIDPSKYAAPARADAASSNELLNLRVRYKQPDGDTSVRMDVPLVDRGGAFARASADFRFAASVAEFGMILRESPYRGNASMESVLDIAQGSRGQDRSGYRQEFIDLVQRARRLR